MHNIKNDVNCNISNLKYEWRSKGIEFLYAIEVKLLSA